MEVIDLELLTSKISSKQEAQRYCKTIGKFIIIKKGFELRDERMFSKEHFYDFMSGRKSLLTTNESTPISIPNYYTCEELQKDRLVEYIQSKEELNKYLPDVNCLKNIPRDFLLMVSGKIY